MKKNIKGAAQIKPTMLDNAGLYSKGKNLSKILLGMGAIIATRGLGGVLTRGSAPLSSLGAHGTGFKGMAAGGLATIVYPHIKNFKEKFGFNNKDKKETPINTSSNQTPNSTPENDAKVQKKFDDTYMKSGSPKMINKLRNIK